MADDPGWRYLCALRGVLAVLPEAGLLSLTCLIGAFAIIFGVAFIVLGFRVKGLGRSSRVT